MKKELVHNTAKGALIGGAGGGAVDLLLQYFELRQQGHASSLNEFIQNYDGNRTLKAIGSGALVGGGVGLVFTLFNPGEEPQTPFNQNNFLHGEVRANRLDPSCPSYQEDKVLVQQVIDFISDKFKHLLLGAPMMAGSIAKRTALHGKADHDIAVPLHPKAGSIAQLHDTFYKEIANKYQEQPGFNVRRQKRTIGIQIERVNGSGLKIDILPARCRPDYAQTGALTIYDGDRNSHLKTNIRLHNEITRNQREARDITILLKSYCATTGLRIPSAVITNYVPKVLALRRKTGSIASNLRFSLGKIGDKMDSDVLKDPANSNNNLMGSMTRRDRQKVKHTFTRALDALEENPRHLIRMFNPA